MGFPKKLLGQDETVVMLLRPHVKRLVVPVLTLLVVAPAATFAAAMVPPGSVQGWARGFIALAALLVLLRWTAVPFAMWWSTVYVITNRRLVMRHGVLTRSGHDMPLSRLNDVSFSHNLLDRIIGCGTLTVESAGERGQVVLADVPKVEQVQRVLYRLSDEQRQGMPAYGRRSGRFAAEVGESEESLDDEPDDGARQDGARQDGDHPDDPGEGRHSRWGRRQR
ncbi:MAG TPA: PH domain-containing protein [Kineosporiaceae bacterium]